MPVPYRKEGLLQKLFGPCIRTEEERKAKQALR
jgi:hypothetical protein